MLCDVGHPGAVWGDRMEVSSNEVGLKRALRVAMGGTGVPGTVCDTHETRRQPLRNWRRQGEIDKGQGPGPSTDELAAAPIRPGRGTQRLGFDHRTGSAAESRPEDFGTGLPP